MLAKLKMGWLWLIKTANDTALIVDNVLMYLYTASIVIWSHFYFVTIFNSLYITLFLFDCTTMFGVNGDWLVCCLGIE